MWRGQPLLWSDGVSTFPRRWIHATIEELWFLCGPCWRFIKKAEENRLNQLCFETPACQELGSRGIELRNQNYWVQFSGVESLAVIWRFYVCYSTETTITGAARSKAWTVFARSNTGLVGSNPTEGMYVCVRLFCVFVVLCVGSGLTTDWFPSKESYRLCIKR
jgi:hypothetical protein